MTAPVLPSSENGFNPTTVPNLGLAWKTSDAGPSHGVFSQPIVSNGLVYWGSFDGYERATTTSGNLVWQTNLGTDEPLRAAPTPLKPASRARRRSRRTFRSGRRRRSSMSAAATRRCTR